MDNELLNNLHNLLRYFFFVLALCLEVLVLIMVRAKLDSSMIIIMIAYLLSFFFRLP